LESYLTMAQFQIAGKMIGDSHDCFIIAEAGVNHNGSLKMAKQLIGVASRSGADAVKFQTFKVKNLILENVEKAPYQTRTTDKHNSQMDMLEKLQINENFHVELIQHCKKNNILFLSTPYDEQSLNMLIKLGVPAIKIASTDATNLLFLEKVAKTDKPVILSTGMCDISEVQAAYRCLRKNGCKDLALLKCTSDYPTNTAEVNLKAMITLAKIFDAVIGFSDHTNGIGASPYAVALGAKIVEKHFTLDKKLPGPDHEASLSPEELKKWVQEIKKVELMLGSAEVLPTKSEQMNKRVLQKNLVSKIEIDKGTVLSRNNLTAKRTGGIGIPAVHIYEVLGLRSLKKIKKNQPIHWSMLES
jgi:N,N'-diacetyllegionaminate synthase